MKKYNVIIEEKVRSILYEVEAESEVEAKSKVEEGNFTHLGRKDLDSSDLVVESVELIN